MTKYLNELLDKNNSHNWQYNFISKKDALIIVKEWLTQKRQEIEPLGIPLKQISNTIQFGKIQLIDELLEELKNE